MPCETCYERLIGSQQEKADIIRQLKEPLGDTIACRAIENRQEKLEIVFSKLILEPFSIIFSSCGLEEQPFGMDLRRR